MVLRQHLKEVWERAKQYTIFEELPAEELDDANKYAQAAYDYCVALYGPPLDPQKPYFVRRAIADTSFCRYQSGKYYLAIDKAATTPEELCTHIAHEMYHRVTYGHKGFASEMWVQEMMAFLTEQWFLRKQGFKEYAEDWKKLWMELEGKADAVLLRASKHRNHRAWLLRGEEIYSDAFSVSLYRIGYALIQIVAGNDLRRIIQASKIED